MRNVNVLSSAFGAGLPNDEYEVGSWDMLTELFNECLAEIVKRFVDSMSCNPEVCVDIVEQLLEMKESL